MGGMKMSRMMKLAALTCGCLVAGMTAASATTLRFSDYGPNRGARAEALQWYADQIKERSAGDLEIQFFWGGSLLGGKATLKGVGDGVADLGTVIGFFTPREMRAYNIGDLPVDNSDIWVGLRSMYALSTENETMKQEFAKANVRYLTNYSTGPVQLICNQEITGLDQLKNAKVRASGPYGDTLRSLGVDVVGMSQADVYQALDSGLIDCNQNYYYSMLAYKQYEVAQHVLELDWGQNMSFGVAINDRTYASLSDKQRQVLDEVSSDFEDYLAQKMIETDATAKSRMVDGIDGKKITVTTLSPADQKTLIEASATAIDAWVSAAKEDGIDSEALLSDYRDLIGKYAKEQKESGYPWTR